MGTGEAGKAGSGQLFNDMLTKVPNNIKLHIHMQISDRLLVRLGWFFQVLDKSRHYYLH